eukprot:CAMPEP_0114139784 /NCGR_PEP_ID=MMETSP0043_2-20121206/17039_1 /TAXON_ID=464988 /ORGANISM="Hemiselmis andersenii, Strain CCMP644" /LENGTH=326 /DNA_ID=CAMNT_0001233841 /DNA_START=151 /DNA_END=1127 /DNA_ORIENTATION=+
MFHAFDLRQGGLLEKIPGHATSLSLPALFPPAASGVPLGGQDWRLAMAREAIDAANLMNKSEQPVSSSTDLDMSIGAAALMELAQGAGRASEKQEPKVECPPKEDIPAPGPSELVRGANTAGVQAHDTRTRRPVPAPAPTTTVAHRATKGGGGRTGPQPAGQTLAAGEVHVVLPRRKAGEVDAPERDAVVVTAEVLESLFHHPLAVASRKLGLSATTIKKLCRRLGIRTWPYKSPFRAPRAPPPSGGGARAPGRRGGEKRRGSAESVATDGEEARSTPSPTMTAPSETGDRPAELLSEGDCTPGSPAREAPSGAGRPVLMSISSIL